MSNLSLEHMGSKLSYILKEEIIEGVWHQIYRVEKYPGSVYLSLVAFLGSIDNSAMLIICIWLHLV